MRRGEGHRDPAGPPDPPLDRRVARARRDQECDPGAAEIGAPLEQPAGDATGRRIELLVGQHSVSRDERGAPGKLPGPGDDLRDGAAHRKIDSRRPSPGLPSPVACRLCTLKDAHHRHPRRAARRSPRELPGRHAPLRDAPRARRPRHAGRRYPHRHLPHALAPGHGARSRVAALGRGRARVHRLPRQLHLADSRPRPSRRHRGDRAAGRDWAPRTARRRR